MVARECALETMDIEQDDDEIERSRMTLGEHLSELRLRLFRSAAVVLVAFSLLYTYREEVKTFVAQPQQEAFQDLREDVLKPRMAKKVQGGALAAEDVFVGGEFEVLEDGTVRGKLVDERAYLEGLTSLNSMGPFFYAILVCFWLGLALAAPYVLWEVWGFIAAGLYKHERWTVYKLLPPAIALFYAGLFFGFKFVVPAAIYFTQADGLGIEDPPVPRQINLDEYWGFLRGLALALGIVFQIPIVQIVLSKAGLVNPATYAKYRGHTAIALLVFAAVITPPDVITQLLLAGPAIVLWEIGYWVARLTVPAAAFADLESDAAEPA